MLCRLPLHFFLPIRTLIESEPQFMPMLCAAFSCAVSALARTQVHQSVCLIHDTSYAFIQQRRDGGIAGLYCSCCIRERAEGGIGGRFWGKVCKLFSVDVCFDDPCLFSLSSLAILGDGEVNVCQQGKQVHLAAIAVGSSRVALV